MERVTVSRPISRGEKQRKRFSPGADGVVFFAAACVSSVAVLLICLFLFMQGVPAIRQIGLVDFVGGSLWKPTQNLFGIFPMIAGSFSVTGLAMIFGIPAGVLTAVYLVYICPKWLTAYLTEAVNLLAGIPSVVFGFFGMVIIVPLVRKTGLLLKGAGVIRSAGNGSSLLAAGLLLGIMILPTIISTTASALQAVPTGYMEGALALGASRERSIFTVMIPAASSGIWSGIVLGIGRAVGETMAVIMVAGNQAWFPKGLFKGVRTLTANIVIEMGYAADLHREALIATGVVLFVFILLINILLNILKRKGRTLR